MTIKTTATASHQQFLMSAWKCLKHRRAGSLWSTELPSHKPASKREIFTTKVYPPMEQRGLFNQIHGVTKSKKLQFQQPCSRGGAEAPGTREGHTLPAAQRVRVCMPPAPLPGVEDRNTRPSFVRSLIYSKQGNGFPINGDEGNIRYITDFCTGDCARYCAVGPSGCLREHEQEAQSPCTPEFFLPEAWH